MSKDTLLPQSRSQLYIEGFAGSKQPRQTAVRTSHLSDNQPQPSAPPPVLPRERFARNLQVKDNSVYDL